MPLACSPVQKGEDVKLVIGITRPEKVNDVLEALYRAEVRGVSISRVQPESEIEAPVPVADPG